MDKRVINALRLRYNVPDWCSDYWIEHELGHRFITSVFELRVALLDLKTAVNAEVCIPFALFIISIISLAAIMAGMLIFFK